MSNTDIDKALEMIYDIYGYKIRAIFIPRILCVNFYFESQGMSMSKEMLDKITLEELFAILTQTFKFEDYGTSYYEHLCDDNIVNDECLFESEIEQAFHDAGRDWAYIV